MTSSRLGWVAGRGTAICLLISLIFSSYLFTPVWWSEIGADAKVLYAAGAVAASGGDPYQVAQQNAMEDVIYGAGRGQSFGHAPYGYPPLLTVALRASAALPEVAFYLLTLAVLVASGLVGFEFCLDLMRWQRRGLPRALFLASTPMALDAFIGNPSAVLLLASGAGAWLVSRGRPFAGGLALAAMSLKPQVGLPIALATLLGAPFATSGPGPGVARSWLATSGGLAAGSSLLVLLGVLLEGHAATVHWFATLVQFGVALGPGGHASAFTQSGLAGFPSLLGGTLPIPAAVLAVAVVVAPLAGLAVWSARHALEHPTVAPLALAISSFLALSPYLHLNDLVLGALPVLLVASRPQSALTRLTLLLWTIGSAARLVVGTLLASRFGLGATGQAGFGVVLTGSLLLSVVWVMVSRGPRRAAIAAP